MRFESCALMNPRTLWGCQPVAVMSVLSVAPSGRRRSAITFSVFVVARFAVADFGFGAERFAGICGFPAGAAGVVTCNAAQIRRIAVFRSVNFRTGRTPGNAFQM